MQSQTYAIIPALNEEATITAVVQQLLAQGVAGVIVVDNGSTDQTAGRAQSAGARVVLEQVRGYGRACLTGIAALPAECEWVLFCDADGSDDLSELPRLWAEQSQHDLILGNRRATPEGRANLTSVQNFGNWLSGFLLHLGWGQGFADLGPLRLIRREALERIGMQDENFGWTVEMQAQARTHRLRCIEVPVNYRPRQGGVSKISGNLKGSAQAGTIILRTLGQLWLQRPPVQVGLLVLSLLLLIGGALLMGLGSDPASATRSSAFFLAAAIMSAGFLVAVVRTLGGGWSPLLLLAVALLLRLCLLPMPPGDDIWRYIWEGLIQLQGHNPYNTPPAAADLTALRPSWWHRINHPEVTAIYPPLAQHLFRLISAVSPSVLAYKLIIITADLLTGWLLLRHYGRWALLYLLNPLVLYCFAGGGHYEPLFLLPLVVAVPHWEQQSTPTRTAGWRPLALIGLLVGLSTSLKLVALLSAGFIMWRLVLGRLPHTRWLRPLYFFTGTPPRSSMLGVVAYVGGLVLVPLLSYWSFAVLISPPAQLYPAEFSEIARSTSLLPWLAEHYLNDTDIPIENQEFLPLLCLLLVPITLCTRDLSAFLYRSLLVLLICSPMVHAWYLAWLIPFALRMHRASSSAFALTGFLYFLLPAGLAAGDGWTLTTPQRLLFWSPLLLFLPELMRCIQRSPLTALVGSRPIRKADTKKKVSG